MTALRDKKRITVRFYRTRGGSEPVREFLKALTKDEMRKVGADLMTVEYGWPVGMPVCRAMGNGLHEVRTSLPNRGVRILFCVLNEEAVLLHAFFKESQQTPRKDLALAEDRRDSLAHKSGKRER